MRNVHTSIQHHQNILLGNWFHPEKWKDPDHKNTPIYRRQAISFVMGQYTFLPRISHLYISHNAPFMLCYVMLCYVMLYLLCYVMLCYICYVMLCYVCYVMLCYVTLRYVTLCYVIVTLCYVSGCFLKRRSFSSVFKKDTHPHAAYWNRPSKRKR